MAKHAKVDTDHTELDQTEADQTEADHTSTDQTNTEPAGAVSDAVGNPAADEQDAAASGFDPSTLRFVTRGVSPAERAAVAAVLGGVLEQESAMLGAAPGRGASAWQTSQRVLRAPIVPGHGRWNRPTL